MDAKRARLIARFWIVIGVLGLGLVAVFAASHFLFGVPLYIGSARTLATSWQIAGACAALAAGFCAIAVMGAFRLTRGGSSPDTGQRPKSVIDRVGAVLYWPALILVWIDAALVPASAAGLPRVVVLGAFWATSALAALHFVLVLIDGPTHRALNAYNARALKRVTKRLPQEDLWSSLEYGSLLKLTLVILLVEMMLAALAHGRSPQPMTLPQLAFSAAFLTMLIGILQLKKVPVPAESGPSEAPAV